VSGCPDVRQREREEEPSHEDEAKITPGLLFFFESRLRCMGSAWRGTAEVVPTRGGRSTKWIARVTPLFSAIILYLQN
jgi:hypothetical protein